MALTAKEIQEVSALAETYGGLEVFQAATILKRAKYEVLSSLQRAIRLTEDLNTMPGKRLPTAVNEVVQILVNTNYAGISRFKE